MMADDADLKRFFDVLRDQPELLPDDILHRAMQQRMVTLTNQGMVEGGPSIREYFEKNPESALLMRIYVDAWAIVTGQRLVDDKIISESVREAKTLLAKRKGFGFFRRVGHALVGKEAVEMTAIIKRYEELAAEMVALERLKLQREKECSDAVIAADETMKKARLEAHGILDRAATHASELIAQIGSALEAKRADLQKEIQALTAEVNEKRKILANLDATPGVLEGWNKRMDVLVDYIAAVMIWEKFERNGYLTKGWTELIDSENVDWMDHRIKDAALERVSELFKEMHRRNKK